MPSKNGLSDLLMAAQIPLSCMNVMCRKVLTGCVGTHSMGSEVTAAAIIWGFLT